MHYHKQTTVTLLFEEYAIGRATRTQERYMLLRLLVLGLPSASWRSGTSNNKKDAPSSENTAGI
jgi:hypothetical protein